MLNRKFEQIAKTYQDQLIKHLSSDKEFLQSAEKLAELEIKSNNFDHVGHILHLTPDVPFIGGIINGSIDYLNDFKKHLHEKEIEEHRAFLSSVLRSTIEKIQPDLKSISATDALGYEYFLTSLKANYLNEKNNDVLDGLKERARIVAVSANSEEINAGINELKDTQIYLQESINLSLKANLALLRGQRDFENLLASQHAQIGMQNDKIDDVTAMLAELGVKTDDKLLQFLQNNEKARAQVKATYDHLKNKKQQERKEDYQGVMDAFGFVNEMGKHFNNKGLCQIGTIGHAAAKISLAAELLSGKAFSLASLSSYASIGTAILSLVSLFGRQRKQEDPNKIILDAIRSLAEQVYAIHERLDRIEKVLGRIYSFLIDKFCDLRLDNFTIKNLLEEIEHELQTGHRDIKDSLSTLSQRLQSIANRQRVAERKNKISTIYEKINRINGPHQIDTSEFKELFNALTTEMNNLHPNDIFLIGEGGDEANVVKAFEEDMNNHFASDFNIASVRQYIRDKLKMPQQSSGVINPLMWCWETMAMMVLMQRRYQRSAKPEFYISKAEVETLHKLQRWGTDIQSFIVALQHPHIFNHLKDTYVDAGCAVKSKLDNYFADQEQTITHEINQAWQKQVDAFSELPIEAFRSQDMPVAIDRNPNWFKSYSTNHHPNFVKMFAHGYDGPYRGNHGYTENEKVKYVQARKNDINTFKENYIRSIRYPLLRAGQGLQALHDYQFKVFSEIEGSQNLYHAFILPETEGEPVLPMPTHYRPQIPQEILQAEWLGLGKIKFSYRIENGQLLLHTNFVTPNQTYPIASLSTPYQPGIYTGNEAIWIFWVGGNYNLDGSISDVMVHSYQTHETNVWKYHTYLPVCTYHEGCRDKIKYDANHVLQNAEETIHLNNNSPQLAAIKNIIKVSRQAYGKRVTQELKDKLGRDDNSELAKAIIHFSHQFYMLQSILFLAFRDDERCKQSVLKYFNNEERQFQTAPNNNINLFRNRVDLLALLEAYQDDNSHFANALTSNLEFFKRLIENFSAHLTVDAKQTHYDLLEITLAEFARLITWYEKHAVDENTVVTSLSKESLLQQQNDMQLKLLQAVGMAVASVTNVDQQREIISLLQKQNIILPTEMVKLLLPGDKVPIQTIDTNKAKNTNIVGGQGFFQKAPVGIRPSKEEDTRLTKGMN